MRRIGLVGALSGIIAASLATLGFFASPASASGWPVIDASGDIVRIAWPIHRSPANTTGAQISTANEWSGANDSGCAAWPWTIQKPLAPVVRTSGLPLGTGPHDIGPTALPDEQDLAALPFDEEFGWLVKQARIAIDASTATSRLPEEIDII